VKRIFPLLWVVGVLTAGLAGCGAGNSGNSAPWNTALTPQTHPYFNIATGSHANVDCNICHGAFATFAQYDCTACHEHDQPTMDAVHLGAAPVPGYVYSATSCYQCHPQ
jgi:hypothetical protein